MSVGTKVSTIGLSGYEDVQPYLPYAISLAGALVGAATHGLEHQENQPMKDTLVQSIYHSSNMVAQVAAPITIPYCPTVQRSFAYICGGSRLFVGQCRQALYKLWVGTPCNIEKKEVHSLGNFLSAAFGISAISSMVQNEKPLAAGLFIGNSVISIGLSLIKLMDSKIKWNQNAVKKGTFLIGWGGGLVIVVLISKESSLILRTAQLGQYGSVLMLGLGILSESQENNQVIV